MTNASELVKKDLIHTYAGMPLDEFFVLIDGAGGWPIGYKSISFYTCGPTGNRYCKLTKTRLRNDNWSPVCSDDDYYYWKLSDEKKQILVKQARDHIIEKLYYNY